jgi:hypothetical protein
MVIRLKDMGYADPTGKPAIALKDEGKSFPSTRRSQAQEKRSVSLVAMPAMSFTRPSTIEELRKQLSSCLCLTPKGGEQVPSSRTASWSKTGLDLGNVIRELGLFLL